MSHPKADLWRAKWDRVVEIKRDGRDLYRRVQMTPLDQLSEGDREAFNSMARELKKLDPAATHIEELE